MNRILALLLGCGRDQRKEFIFRSGKNQCSVIESMLSYMYVFNSVVVFSFSEKVGSPKSLPLASTRDRQIETVRCGQAAGV